MLFVFLIIGPNLSAHAKRTLEKGYFDSVRFCREQGVRIASGSDFSGGDTLLVLPMGKNAAELQALVRAGLPSLDARAMVTTIKVTRLLVFMYNARAYPDDHGSGGARDSLC